MGKTVHLVVVDNLPDLLHYFFFDYYFFLPGEVAEAVDLFVSFM